MHWGADNLYKSLNQKLIGQNLYTVIKQVTQRCEMCLKISQGNSGKLVFPDSQELRGYQYLLNEWTPQRIIQYYKPATWDPNELINGA